MNPRIPAQEKQKRKVSSFLNTFCKISVNIEKRNTQCYFEDLYFLINSDGEIPIFSLNCRLKKYTLP